jgi:predicted Ser/Thr protein kinase
MVEPRTSSEGPDPLDRGIALCLDHPEGGRPALVEWLAEHSDLALALARFLAEDAELARETAPIREALAPAEVATFGHDTEPKLASPAALTLKDFDVTQELGRGGMGVVFHARQVSLNRVVALKTTLAGRFLSKQELARFRFEAEAAASLDHPNIVPIYGAGEQEGIPFFFMKYVPGGTLSDQIDPLRDQPRAAAALLAKVAEAVHYAHQRGVLHRDLKPSNILIDQDGEPMIADFGLAKSVGCDPIAGHSTGIVGTASYMAPEQARAERRLTTAADVFGLGAVLYHLLTGNPPFLGETPYETIRLVLEHDAVPPQKLNPAVPPDLGAICLKCLEKRPEDRYPSAASLAEDLRRFAEGEAISLRWGGFLSRLGRSLGTYREAFGRPKNNWVFQCVMMSVVWLITHGTIFSLVASEARIASVWAVLGVYYAVLLATRVQQGRRSRDCSPWERHAIATLVAALALIPFDPAAPASAVLPWYPALAALYVLSMVVMMSISWGGALSGALAFSLLAVSLRHVGSAAPLVFGVSMCVIMTANAFAFTRHASRRLG